MAMTEEMINKLKEEGKARKLASEAEYTEIKVVDEIMAAAIDGFRAGFYSARISAADCRQLFMMFLRSIRNQAIKISDRDEDPPLAFREDITKLQDEFFHMFNVAESALPEDRASVHDAFMEAVSSKIE